MHGEEIWLGHGDAPRLEHRGTLVRVWSGTGPHARTPVEFHRTEPADLLRTVHEKLNGFLALVEPWARHHAPALAPALITRLSEDLDIGAPLENARLGES